MGLRDRPVLIMVALAALAGLVSACTSSEQGTPTPDTSSSAPTAPPTSASAPTLTSPPTTGSGGTTIANPIDLSGVKPCSLFTSAVSAAAQTSGDGGTPQKVEVTSLPDATGCFQVNGKANVGLTIAIALSTDVNGYSKSQAGAAQQFDVKGYPVVVFPASGGLPGCLGGIGMADHQMVYLRYGLANPTASPQVPRDELCSRLRPVAEQVVAKLTG
ncbi:DUF3558 family protein [Labedaea rhizosphaerae]|uniref:Uncharacterized protein DUF3558 n=1 Tax=Labedaea rhizosphaerae TaxID=598644 RepID=A0A4R6SQ62_LABRH|nr:DUF3558 family protein [Labedaea rhizosphaerae]TDQ05403.1 uncharacterized protein DUF3558 [Labedaea rhizosphaerae]